MTSTRVLARNTALNLFAQVAPLLVAVVSIPVLIKALGDDRFGVLALAWTLIGYFGLFDLGISRALTQAASEALGRNDPDTRRLSEVSSAGLGAMFAVGLIGAALLALLTPWLAFKLLKMPDGLRAEAAISFYVLAASLPFVVSTMGFRGLFEAHQHFGAATALRLPYAIISFAGPLLVLPFTHNLVVIVAVLALARILTWFAHAIIGLRLYPWLADSSWFDLRPVVPLLRMGGWMTVSNIVSPLMVNLDRFLIGALLSMTAVAYYITPFEVVTKLLFVSGAILGVFFPAFALTYARDRQQTASMLDRALRVIIVAVFPAALVAVGLAREVLLVFVGPDYAREGAAVMQVLAIGVFINSVGQGPFGLLQGIGRPDLTAKLHLVEVPLYAVVIYLLTVKFGLLGVALAWTLRIAFDTSLLSIMASRHLPEATASLRRAMLGVVLACAALTVILFMETLAARLLVTGVAFGLFLPIAWRGLLLPSERAGILRVLHPQLRRTPNAG